MRPFRILNFFIVSADKLTDILSELVSLRREVMAADKEIERLNNELAYYMRQYLDAMNHITKE